MKKNAAAALLILGLSLSLTACTETPSGGTTEAEIPSGGTTGAENESEYVPLSEFCDSEDLTAWFDRIQNETPAKLTYAVFTKGGGTHMEYTDPDIISSIAESLRTLPIGPEAGSGQKSADSDFQYRFEMEDGSITTFLFFQKNFHWKGAEYEVDWKDFPELYIYREYHADEAGFSTKCYGWVEEEGDSLQIYPKEKYSLPCINICRYEDPGMDAEDFVKEYIPVKARESYEGCITGEDEFFRFPLEDGDDALPSVLITYDDDGDRYSMLFSCKQAGDDLIIFETKYPEGQEQAVRGLLETAIRELEISEPMEYYDLGPGGLIDPDVLY